MNNSKDILDELNSLCPSLIPLKKANVFTVPENYFEGLSDQVWAGIRPGQPSFLSGDAINIMDVPAGYFDSLAEVILSKIKALRSQSAAEELIELSPALSATGNDNVFKVPGRYFEDLPEIILSRVNAKVVAMKPRRSIARYAAAAVVTGILGLSLFTAFNKKTTMQEDNIVLTASAASVIEKANHIIKTNSFEKELESVSDDEIVGYLENNGQDVEAALVAASTDSKELPAQDEYIFNENTLDNYLKELNINNYSN